MFSMYTIIYLYCSERSLPAVFISNNVTTQYPWTENGFYALLFISLIFARFILGSEWYMWKASFDIGPVWRHLILGYFCSVFSCTATSFFIAQVIQKAHLLVPFICSPLNNGSLVLSTVRLQRCFWIFIKILLQARGSHRFGKNLWIFVASSS